MLLRFKDITQKNTLQFWQLTLFSTLVCFINCFFYANSGIMYTVVFMEIMWLLFLLVRGRLQQYYCYYIIFMALSLEFPEFVGIETFYGFKSIGIGVANIGVLMILPLFVRILLVRKFKINIKNSFDIFFKQFSIIVGLAFVLGLLHWFFNDNGIAYYATVGFFIKCMYISIYIYVCFFCFFAISKKQEFDIIYIENVLFSIIMAVSITMFLSFIFSNYGVYGGVRTLQICSLSMALPCSIVIFAYRNINIERRLPVFIASIILTILSLAFNANGKTVLSLGVSVVFLMTVFFRRNKVYFFIFLFCIPLAFFIGLNALEYMGNQSFLLTIKMKQAFSMIAFWQDRWFENLSLSPKARIQEFLTILAEYANKPWDFIFGKGYMGSTLDNLGYFVGATETGFSRFELDHGIYINMHESANSMFLMSGVYGLVFYLRYLFKAFRTASYSFWGVLSTFWFGLFFSYSITIAVFGITAFCLAMIMSDYDKKKKVYVNQVK